MRSGGVSSTHAAQREGGPRAGHLLDWCVSSVDALRGAVRSPSLSYSSGTAEHSMRFILPGTIALLLEDPCSISLARALGWVSAPAIRYEERQAGELQEEFPFLPLWPGASNLQCADYHDSCKIQKSGSASAATGVYGSETFGGLSAGAGLAALREQHLPVRAPAVAVRLRREERFFR